MTTISNKVSALFTMAKALAAALVLFASYGTSTFAQQIFTVDRRTDTGEGDGLMGDLRYCITNATDGDSITFVVTGTINLTQALPDLNQSIDIEGPGSNLLTVRRNTGGDYRVFTVTSGTVTISGLAIANGVAASGGGVYNSGTLTISDARISQNDRGIPSEINGGGIYNSGNLSVGASTISGNGGNNCFGCGGYGAGIYNSNTGSLTINDSTISGNVLAGWSFDALAYAVGAGVFNGGTLTISNSTISHNRAETLSCSYDCESRGVAGGIGNWGTATLMISNSTVSGNSANNSVGGIAGSLYMRNTILAQNYDYGDYSFPDLGGRLLSSGYNLIGNSNGGTGYDETDLLNVDPLLGPLQDNGGPTFTQALLPGSPAIDAGDPDFVGPPDFDQRGDGFPRIVNGIVDIGAFEVQSQ
jgi:hypothetical protein